MPATTSEWAQALAWIQSTLNGDSTINTTAGYGGVWEGEAPTGTSRPFFLVQHFGGSDQNTAGFHRIWSGPTFLLKATGEAASYALLDAMYARADYLLTPAPDGANRFPLVLTNVVILSCERIQPHSLPYSNAGNQYIDLGGVYQLTAKTH